MTQKHIRRNSFLIMTAILFSVGMGQAFGAVTSASVINSITVNANDSVDIVCTDPTYDAAETIEGRQIEIDNDAGFGSPEVTVGGPADLATLTCDGATVNNVSFTGNYDDGDTINVRLTVFDDGNNDSTDTDTFTVGDNTIPVITLTGADPQTIELGAGYSELGATATDNIDGDITGSIVIDSSAFVDAVGGPYVITYNVDDAAGNSATEVTRDVNVVDTTDPTFNLVTSGTAQGGSFTTNIVKDVDTYTADTFENQADLSGIASSVVGGDTVNTSVIAVYTVTYTVTDNNGNTSVVTETVNVIAGGTPVITLTGADPESVVVNGVYTDAGATATDTEDGDITGSITTGGLPIDTSAVGSFTVTYDVTDSSGNAATQVTRDVDVVLGNAPVLTVNGGTVNLKFGQAYSDAGASCTDVEDGDITASIVTSGDNINTGSNKAGFTTTVTYSCTDSSGNTVEETRTVKVASKEGGNNKKHRDTRPTMGLKHGDDDRLVDNGLTLNLRTVDVVPFHTEFPKQVLQVGEPNKITVKVLANHGLKLTEFSLDCPEITKRAECGGVVSLHFDRDGEITEMEVERNRDNILDESSLKPKSSMTNCLVEDTDEKCNKIQLDFSFNQELAGEVFIVQNIDFNNRPDVVSFNDGFIVIGESLNPPKIDQHRIGKVTANMTQIDSIENLWSDGMDGIWTQNKYLSWIQVTFPELEERNDPHQNVMTRINSNFQDTIKFEQDRAVMQFDSNDYVSILAEPETIEYEDRPNRLENTLFN